MSEAHEVVYHKDHTVTMWSPFSETFVRTAAPSDALLRTLPVKVRAKVERHVRGFRGDLG